jgi:hypothetical protein
MQDGVTAGEIFDDSVTDDDREAVRVVLRARFSKIGTSHIYAHEAARVGNLERIKWYLDAGGDIVSIDGGGSY